MRDCRLNEVASIVNDRARQFHWNTALLVSPSGDEFTFEMCNIPRQLHRGAVVAREVVMDMANAIFERPTRVVSRARSDVPPVAVIHGGSYMRIASSDQRSLVDTLPWVQTLYDAEFNDDQSDTTTLLFSSIDDLLDSGRIALVNRLLREVEFDRLHPQIIVGLIRITFPARDLLLEWASAVDRVEDALEQKGYQKNTLLRGIRG